MSIHVPTLLEGILEATAAKAQAEARITTLRATLEDVARRRYASEGAAPSWNTPQLGKVRLDPAGEWDARVDDPDTFAGYVAEHYPTEATVAIHVAAADAEDALQALTFIGVKPVDTPRVEVRSAWLAGYLKGLALDVTEERDDSAQLVRTVVAADTSTGAVVPGIGVTRSEAKLVVSLDRDRRTAAITEARTSAAALVEAASEDADDAPAELAELDTRRRELEALHADQLAGIAKGHGLGSSGTKAALAERIARAELATGHVVRPASTVEPPAPLPEGTEVEEVSTLDPEEDADLAELVDEVNAAPEVTLEHVDDEDQRRDEVAVAIEALGSREVLRQHAKRHGVNAAGTKAEVAIRLAQAGHTATTLKELSA